MPKVILIGKPETQYNIDGHYKPGGTVIELTEKEITEHSDVVYAMVNGKGELILVDRPKVMIEKTKKTRKKKEVV